MKTIDAITFKNMIINGANKIANNFSYINELNVFPIPDGDTGTNMKITVEAAANDIAILESNDLYKIGRTFSKSLLMNARGNSGVIFSQIMKGFITPITIEDEVIDKVKLVECFKCAKEIAYKSVANPVEGTILTVIREISENLCGCDLEQFQTIQDMFAKIALIAKEALDSTPELLPQLKKVGVVDSGGYGLYMFILGMNEAFEIKGKDLINKTKVSVEDEELRKKIKLSFDNHYNEEGFGYCSEIIMKIGARIDPSSKDKKPFNFNEFKSELEKKGNSLVCVQDEELVKVHVHTFNPGDFLSYAQQFGEFIKVKFENMTEQYYERIADKGVELLNDEPSNKKIVLDDRQEVVLTCPSAKIKKILKDDYNLTNVLNTEKIGNPSIQDILLAIQNTKANKVFFITDDTNIVLAANQAKDIIRDQVEVKVIGGSNIFEALIAALDFDPNTSFATNERNMQNTIKNSLSGMVSKAIKDVDYDDINIKVNDYIGIINKKIIVSDIDEELVLKSVVDELVKKGEDPSILMVYYNNKKSLTALEELEKYVTKKYNLMCDFKEGGQKVYNYLLGIQ